MSRTVLHACCGPCASACVPRLREMGREVTLLFANSNLDTREEYERRLAAAARLAAADGVRLVAVPYDHADWLQKVAAGHEDAPERGARCARCFRYSLEKAAAFAEAQGCDEFTTSLTVSPHKVTETVFAAGKSIRSRAAFLPVDFKKRDGFNLSTRRAAELGLYRQSYCGCEFSRMPHWQIHHKDETASTNLDARTGQHGDVFTADFQTAGRGRLDHRWLSPPGTNLMMSVVLSVVGLSPEQVATLPLVMGLAVARSVRFLLQGSVSAFLKWPNDVLVAGKKLAGILCERQGDNVIVGIGLNVKQETFLPEIADKATSLAILMKNGAGDRPQPEGVCPSLARVRTVLLSEIGRWYACWRSRGFAGAYPFLSELDYLKGRWVSVLQSDDDMAPLSGYSSGIRPDGALDVGGRVVYAGEAHVAAVGEGLS